MIYSELKACSACQSSSIHTVFKHENRKHNSLLGIDPQGLNPDAKKSQAGVFTVVVDDV
jgi:hypothetical protein